MAICPSRGVKTFRDTRLAVGRCRLRTGYAPVHPTNTVSEPRKIRAGELTEDGDRENEEQVDVQKLAFGQ